MKPSRPGASWVVFAAALGFLAGMLVMAAIVVMFPSGAAVGRGAVDAGGAEGRSQADEEGRTDAGLAAASRPRRHRRRR